ncbi:MAG: hypothetical protein P8M80_05155 [Pirellulaceae bacterium]|nr:hypothetical protein [Pirellulaceae bacterium]
MAQARFFLVPTCFFAQPVPAQRLIKRELGMAYSTGMSEDNSNGETVG